MATEKKLKGVHSACHNAPVVERSSEVAVPKPPKGASIVVGQRKPTKKEIADSKFKIDDNREVELTLPDKIDIREEVKHQKMATRVEQVCLKCDEPTSAVLGPVDKDWDKESAKEEEDGA